MTEAAHPAISRLFRAHDTEALDHVAGCARCRALRRLGYERTLAGTGCAEIEPLLAARVVGAVAADDERRLLEHLEICSTCFTLASDLDGVVVSQGLVDLGIAGDFPEMRVVDDDNYVRGGEIARGGMGRVVHARDRRLGRQVVLKELLDERLRVRFEQEARLTARLQHPAIVNVHEAGRWPSGDSFYAMKHVAGTPLDRAIAERHTLHDRLGLLPNLITVVEAVAYAHSVRVIHRDLKPGNILVGPFGETVVIDWGLAKDLSAASVDPAELQPYRDDPGAFTVGGAGTPSYMPPEQAAGNSSNERVDIYSLGATLYHLLAGEPPYGHDGARQILDRLRQGEPAPLIELEPRVPRALAAIVAKAMAREPAARYASAAELAEELRRFQRGQMVAAHSYTVVERVAQLVRRHRALVTLGAISLLVLAAVGAVALRQVLAARALGERQLAELLLQRGQQELLRDAPSRALPYLLAARQHGLDGPAVRAMLGEATRPLDSLEAGFDVAAPALVAGRFSPDGTRLAVVDAAGVRLLAVPGGALVARLPTTFPPRQVEFSPDGRLLVTDAACDTRSAAGCVPTLRLWAAGDGAAGLVIPLGARPERVAFASASTLLVRTAGAALLVDAVTGESRARSEQPGGARWPVVDSGGALGWTRPRESTPVADRSGDGAWGLHLGLPGEPAVHLWRHGVSEGFQARFEHGGLLALARLGPDARAVLTVGSDGVVKLWDARLGIELAVFDALAAPLLEAQLTADHTQVLTLATDGRVRVWRVTSRLATPRLGSSVTTLDPGLGDAPAPSRSPDGRLRIVREDSSTVALTDVATGQPRARLRDDVRLDAAIFSPRGDRVLSLGVGRAAGIWDLDGNLRVALAVPPGMISAAAWSPDGQQLLTGGRDGAVELWDVATGMAVSRGHAGDGAVDRVAFGSRARALIHAGGQWTEWLVRSDDRPVAELARLAARGPYALTAAAQLVARDARPSRPVPVTRPPEARVLVLEGRWDEAAERYLEAYEQSHDVARLFEAGMALHAAGHAGAGNDLLRQYWQTDPATTARADADREPPVPAVRTLELFEAGQDQYATGFYFPCMRSFLAGALASDLAVFFLNAALCTERMDNPAQTVALLRRYLDLTPLASNRAEIEGRIQAWLERAEAQARGQGSPRPLPGVAPLQRGTVIVESQPAGATVSLDDETHPLGRTPWSGPIQGNHTLVISAPGYRTQTRPVEPRPGTLTSIFISLARRP